MFGAFTKLINCSASLLSDVDMAHDEVSISTNLRRRADSTDSSQVFAGLASESVPSSVTGFAHRRSRADSAASFTYMQSDESAEWTEEEAVIDQSDDEFHGSDGACDLGSSPPSAPLGRRRSSVYSRRSVEDPLLQRHDSTRTDTSHFSRGGRSNQKIYIVTEDLTIVVSGFMTSLVGYACYITLCILSCGLAYLVLRWLPRWRVWLVGEHRPLRDSPWVVVENQWGEFELHDLIREQYGHSVSTVFGPAEKSRYPAVDEDDDPMMSDLRFLDYRYIRFCFHPLQDKFMLCSDWNGASWTDVRYMRSGLDSDERSRREQVFGKNQIDIKQKTVPQLLVDETMKRLREISRFECDVRVIRNGFCMASNGINVLSSPYLGRQIRSAELVPGDVYEVQREHAHRYFFSPTVLDTPPDADVGESVPVSKIPATNESLRTLDLKSSTVPPEAARHFLFSGTRIIRARRPQDGKDDEAVALAIVARTGFNTTKGALVRSMLFPKPSGFKFYKDAFRYISVMGGVAGAGFVASFVNFVRLKLAWHLIVVRALDLITIVVPPALPATLTIGTNFALSRLKLKSIFCISPQRVNVGGKLDVICFDKTGTLTGDGLDVLGVRVVHRPAMRFSDLLDQSSTLLPGAAHERDPTVDYSVHKAVLYTMASCHSLRTVGSDLVGDPLDLKMFDFTSWSFKEGSQDPFSVQTEEHQHQTHSVVQPPAGSEFDPDAMGELGIAAIQLRIVKGFEFVSQLRRASVIARQSGNPTANVYVKGAPECMKAIFPLDYEDLLDFYTHRGFRVIACATKAVGSTWADVQKMEREQAESGLDFVGFIIFENKLKPATAGTIEELGQAGIRQVMCTGDNILTAISVARECSLIDRTAHCFVAHIAEGTFTLPYNSRWTDPNLSWQSVDNPLLMLDARTLTPLPPPAESDVSLPYAISNIRNYSLAITGDIFRWMIDFGDEHILRRMLVACQVFARMSPDEKHELVEKLQTIDYCCGFCGDGANDCGALKAADVGISLSEAEASVAAPFTSRVFDISCVPEWVGPDRTQSCVARGQPQVLSRVRFSRPYWAKSFFASLSKASHLDTCGGSVGKQERARRLWRVTDRDHRFVPPVLDKQRSNIENSENTALFLVSCFQYTLSAIVLSVGPPFRQTMANNLPFVVTIVVALLFSSYMLFDPAAWLASFMQLTDMTAGFKVFILVLALGGFACAWIAEQRAFLWLARRVGKTTDNVWPHSRKRRKQYKTLLDNWLLDGGYLPQSVIRYGIRCQLRNRIRLIESTSLEEAYKKKMQYVRLLRTRPMALETATANAQHYEVGTGVLQACLGPRMKYSACLYPTGGETLGQAEVEMLDTYVEKAELKDGLTILDLGLQKKYIDQQASSKGLNNLSVITHDIVDYDFEPSAFDRVVSIEMFEHMKNYELLMAKVAKAMKPGGKLFVHIFSHKTTPYDFEEGWMSTHFFSGGTMPSTDLLHYFQRDLTLTNQWWISGTHYAKTCEDWLSEMGNNRKTIGPHLEATYGKDNAGIWYQRWQIFYMACAELFAFEGGDTWGVSHYLFEKGSG
ncbi:MAG: hypothetical protein Q9173_004097 [Seirophora scorigena]